jgi:hypothetical protein
MRRKVVATSMGERRDDEKQVPWQRTIERTAPRGLGAALQASSAVLASQWRRRHYRSDPQQLRQMSMLDLMVESLIFEVGRSVDSADIEDHPDAAWERTRGVLRLSIERGVAGLDNEFDLLVEVLEGAADVWRAPSLSRWAMHLALEAARTHAHTEMRHMVDPRVVLPTRFGGLVVEIFEPRVVH